MLYVYTGTDRVKARAALAEALEKQRKGRRAVRITDANAPEDLRAALQGGGLFGEARALVFENVFGDPVLGAMLLAALPDFTHSDEQIFVYEEKPSAELRKKLEKYAERAERYDAPARGESGDVFAVASALKRGDKKAAWVGFRREVMAGKAPEALNGVLFWAAKDLFLKSKTGSAERERAARLVSSLAALPHEARRRGVELEYALEAYLLSGK